MTKTGADNPPSKRLLWIVVLLILVAAALLWASSAVVWVGQQFQTPFTGQRFSGASGAVVRPELTPLALAGLAAIAALLATSGLLRRTVGLLVVVAGGVVLWRFAQWYQSGSSVTASFDVPPGSVPVGPLTGNPAGPLLTALAAVVLVIAGLLVAVRSSRMPAMGAKYSAPGAVKQPSRDPDKRLWDALDAGSDPTDEDQGRS